MNQEASQHVCRNRPAVLKAHSYLKYAKYTADLNDILQCEKTIPAYRSMAPTLSQTPSKTDPNSENLKVNTGVQF